VSELGRPANILIVDDTPGKLVALEAILAPLRQTIVTAGSGREALRQLLRQEFALILLDVRMGDMDGFETAALIRKRRQSEHTPIIFLTAFEQAEVDMSRGYQLGAVDYIFSPIMPDVLKAKAAVFVELHQKTAEVQQLYLTAQEASRSKSEFLNMAAHELRTPLSVVAGYLAMLEEGAMGDPPPGWKMPLEMLNAKTAELNKIVDDLLMASRMDVNTLGGRHLVFDLKEAAQAAVKRAEPRAALLKAAVALSAPGEQLLVEADPDHVGRILDNLLNNAMTYCTRPPVIEVVLAGSGEPAVSVRDNGIGIPSDKRELVFERFIRLDDEGLGPVPGTGLGLYISRELARRYGGTVELAASEPGKGSEFKLLLPAAALPHPGGKANGRETEAAGPRPRLRLHRQGDEGEGEAVSNAPRAGRSSTAGGTP